MVSLPVFATGLGLTVFDLTIFVWVASELFGAILIPRIRGRGGSVRVRRDRGSKFLILFTVWVSVTVALAFGYGGLGGFPDWGFYSRVVLIWVGVLFRHGANDFSGRLF